MKKDSLRRSIFYRHRVLWGFGFFIIITALLAGYNFWSLPGGLTEAEMTAASISGHWSPLAVSASSDWLVNLPWNFLQSTSIHIFGLSTFSVRLPAVILMCLVAAGMFFLIKKWSRFSLAMIGGLLMSASVLFISLARGGTPAAMALFLIVCALAAATTIVVDKRSKLVALAAKIAVGICLALLIYFPGGLYVTIALLLTGLLHPKVRLLLVRIKVWKMLLATLLAFCLMLPLIWTVALHWSNGGSETLYQLLLFDGQWSIANLTAVLDALFGSSADLVQGIMVPVITIVGLLLVVIGITRALVDAFSARSYLVLSTLAMTLVISLRQPGLIYLLLLPITLLTALGMEVLISKWYSLFPRNPYARGTAVVMLSVLVMAVACTSLMQYLSNQNYSSTVAYGYNMEFRMVRQEIRSRSNEKVKLVVSSDQLAFYQVMQRNYPNLSVVDTLDKLDATTMILASSGQVVKKTLPSKIITSWHSNDPVLVRIYSK
jgi:hypothetical protein